MSVTRAVSALLLAALLAGCSGEGRIAGPGPTGPPRGFRLGFSANPPRADFDLLLATLELWTRRADAAILHIEPPWDSLLAGVPADSLVLRNQLGLVNYYRAKNLEVTVMLDATHGLDRASESALLVAAGRSITEPEVRRLYRDYAVAIDTLLEPRRLGPGAETNLIREAAPPALYDALVILCNDAAAAVRDADPAVRLFVSVQVETAWGRLSGGGVFLGIARDLADFPFAQELGLSSYPYLGGFGEPEEVPPEYYARLAEGTGLPVLVTEGGWPSATVGTIVSSPAKQARWIRRQTELLDRAHAAAVFQLTFTDLDPSVIPPGSILPLFATLGLVDANLAAKPALAAWDSTFARPRN